MTICFHYTVCMYFYIARSMDVDCRFGITVTCSTFHTALPTSLLTFMFSRFLQPYLLNLQSECIQ